MALHDVSVQPAVHHHAALHVHLVAHAELSQVAAVQRFLHRRYRISTVLYFYYREAHTIVRHTLIYLQFVYKRTLHGEVDILQLMLYGNNRCTFFYYS